MIKRILLLGWLFITPLAFAAEYQMDTKNSHAFIQFRIQHLGYSWLYGRFDKFEGDFHYDEKHPEASSASVVIDMSSVNSNHAERDKHLRDNRFFDVAKFPKTTFKSTAYVPDANGGGKLTGMLTLKGISKEVVIDVEKVGGGPDPWGGVRQGFSGKTTVKLKDFGINYDLGKASTVAEILLDIEGVKR